MRNTRFISPSPFDLGLGDTIPLYDTQKPLCRLFFAAGGSSSDAVGRYNGTHYVEIQTEDETYMLAFYNNYPYGFTLQDGNDYYFYHDPVMTGG